MSVIVNGIEFRTLSDEMFLGPRGVTTKNSRASKTFSKDGFVCNVTNGPADLTVIWTLYYDGAYWPNLVLYSTERNASVSFNTNGSIESNQTASPLVLGNTYVSDGTTYYYSGIDYNGRYTENQLGWPVYNDDYSGVMSAHGGYSESGTTIGVLSSDTVTDTSNKIYEVWVNGVQVYPENAGDILFFIDTSGSMSATKAINGINEAIEKYGHGLMAASSYGEQHEVICEATNSIDDIYDAVRKTSFTGSGDDDNPFESLVQLADSSTSYRIVAVIGDYEFKLSEEELFNLDSAFSAFGMMWEFFLVG